MSSVAVHGPHSPEEYLALEREARFKSQYHDGEIFAMAGASRAHNLIGLNLGAEINQRLKGRSCEAYVNDMRVLVEVTGLYTYPDVTVTCEEPRFLDEEADTLLNPTLIAEILSPSTERYDRGQKFAHYRRVASLREYLLISQDRALIERYTRRGDGWVLTEYNGLDDVLQLDSIECEVPLRDIYARVDVAARGPAVDGGPGA